MTATITTTTSTCWDADVQELVHQGYRPTGRTRDEDQGTRTVTWQIHICQCGQHEIDVRSSATD